MIQDINIDEATVTRPVIKKYVIVPGWLDKEWVTANQLIEFYDVPPKECIILRDPTVTPIGYNLKFLYTLAWLMPREDGNYTD